MLRPGVRHSLVAAALIVATAIALEVTATVAQVAVTPVVIVGVVLGLGFLALGSSRWIGVASAPMAAAVVLEAGFADEPSWVRSIMIGCLWYAALEMSWEAIDRRRDADITRAAAALRLQEVLSVLLLSMVLGLVAATSSSFAPARSVLLQAAVIGAVLTAFVALAQSGGLRAGVQAPRRHRSRRWLP